MAVVVTVIGRGKLRLGTKFAGQQSTCQGDTSQNTDVALTRGGEKLFRGFEAEHIEDNLYALEIGIGDCFERLVHALDADTVEANLALLYQVVEDAKDFWHGINLRRRAVELEKVERFGLQVAQASLHKGCQVLTVVAAGDVG